MRCSDISASALSTTPLCSTMQPYDEVTLADPPLQCASKGTPVSLPGWAMNISWAAFVVCSAFVVCCVLHGNWTLSIALVSEKVSWLLGCKTPSAQLFLCLPCSQGQMLQVARRHHAQTIPTTPKCRTPLSPKDRCIFRTCGLARSAERSTARPWR